MDKKTIDKLYYVHKQPARQGNFTVKDGIVYMKELFKNDVKFVALRIVSESLSPSMLTLSVLILIPLAPSIACVNTTSGLACTTMSNALSKPSPDAYQIYPNTVL